MMYAGSKNKLVQTAELTKVVSMLDKFPLEYQAIVKQWIQTYFL